MKRIDIEQFIKSLTEEEIKGRIYTIDTNLTNLTALISNIYYRIDSNTFLQLTSYDMILTISHYFTKGGLKELGEIRSLGWVDFNKTINWCYQKHNMLRFVAINGDEEKSRFFNPIINIFSSEERLQYFNDITDVSPEGYKHVTYRGDSVYAKIFKVSSGGSAICKIFNYETLEHIGYTNIKNLNG